MATAFNPSRRRFLRGDADGARAPLRPPWALPEPDFSAVCTRCDRCIEGCPEQILVRGADGRPEVDFSRGGCTFCGACVHSCAPGALASVELVPRTAWSERAAVGAGCFAAVGIVCRSCGDVCEPQALRFRLRPGGRANPEIDVNRCNGCGACVSVCPAHALMVRARPAANAEAPA
jgi:ferredoxin-type protein NapF